MDRTQRRAENSEEKPQIRAFEAGGGGNRRRSNRELTFHPIVPPPLDPRVVSAAPGVFSVRIGTFYDRRKHLGHVAVGLGDVAAFAAADDDGGDGSDGALGA